MEMTQVDVLDNVSVVSDYQLPDMLVMSLKIIPSTVIKLLLGFNSH